MTLQSIVPIVITDRIRETRAFYVEQLGLAVSFDHDFYLGVRLGGPGSPELGFMRQGDGAVRPFDGHGLCLMLTVDDADRECERLAAAGVPIVQPISDHPWGTRSFTVRDPNGLEVSLAHPIPAAMEFQACLR